MNENKNNLKSAAAAASASCFLIFFPVLHVTALFVCDIGRAAIFFDKCIFNNFPVS